LERIVEEQYQLAKSAGISLLESSEIPDFERGVYLDLVATDLKRETEFLKSKF